MLKIFPESFIVIVNGRLIFKGIQKENGTNTEYYNGFIENISSLQTACRH